MCWLFPAALCLFSAALPARAQDEVPEQTAISGNAATIVVTVRESTGEPLGIPAMVKLFRAGGIPNGQGTTSKGGRVTFTPQNLGQFDVVVEAAGYKTGHETVSVPIPIRAEVDVYLEPESSSGAPNTPGGVTLTPKAKEALEKGLAALRQNNLDEAEKHLGEATRLAPQHPDVLYLRGVLYLRKSQWADAQTEPENATQIDPTHARAFSAPGPALCDQGKYEAAIAPLEKSLQLGGGGWETHWTLAKAYYDTKKYEPALKESQTALSGSNGRAPEIELLVAQALTAVGRYEDSAAALRGFLKNHADHAEAAKAKRWLERLAAAGKIQSN